MYQNKFASIRVFLILCICLSGSAVEIQAQQVPFYVQHQNWREIPMGWKCMDKNIGKKFLPFKAQGASPAPTLDYPLTFAGRSVSHAFSTDAGFYVGFSTGGLWKLITYPGEDSVSWKMLTNNSLLSQSIGSVTIHPTNPNHIIIGTGSHENGSGKGIYVTKDGGSTWSLSKLPGDVRPDYCYAFAWYKGNLYSATSKGLFVSSDEGITWTYSTVNGVQNNNVTDVVNFGSDAALYMAVGSQGVYQYQAVDSWKKISGNLSASEIDLDCSRNKLFVLSSPELYSLKPDSSLKLINRSTQGTFNTLRVSADERVLYVANGGAYIYRSYDGGMNFIELSGGIHTDQRGFAMHPKKDSTIYAICDGGVYRSFNDGNLWYNLNIGLQTFQCTDMACDDHGNLTMFGTQDNGSYFIRNNNVSLIFGGDAGSVHFGSHDSLTTYRITSGVIASKSNPDLSPVQCCYTFYGGGWLNSLEVNPLNSNVQYLSTDGGLYKPCMDSCQPPSSRVPNNPFWQKIIDKSSSFEAYVNFVVIDKLDTGKVYFLNRQDNSYVVYKTSNSGATWTVPQSIQGNSLYSIESSPNKSGRSFVVGGNTSRANVLLSDNYADAYTMLPDSLPPMQVYDILETPKTKTGVIQRYTSNWMGVYWTFGKEGIWFKTNGVLPNIGVTRLKYHTPSGTVRAATYGRGIWEFPCPVFATTDVSLSNLNETFYGSSKSIRVQNNVKVNKPGEGVHIVGQNGTSFGNGFSVAQGTRLTVYTFKEIE